MIYFQVVKFFFSVKQLADRKLLDGTGHKPTYSLRTLCRALDIASQNFCQNPKRSLLEAFLMCFLTELDRSSYPVVFGLVLKHFGKGEAVTTLKTPIAKPPSGTILFYRQEPTVKKWPFTPSPSAECFYCSFFRRMFYAAKTSNTQICR